MPVNSEQELGFLFEQLAALDEDPSARDRKLQLAKAIRSHSARSGDRLDEFLVDTVGRLKRGLERARESQRELRQVLDKLTAAPWYPAIYLGPVSLDAGPAASVMLGNGSASRVVGFAQGISPDAFEVGDEVLLGSEMNVVMAKSPRRVLNGGETASFDRRTSEGRAVLRSRDEEHVVTLSAGLRAETLRPGDVVKWNRHAFVALEKIDGASESGLFVSETPSESFEDIGGLTQQIAKLQRQFLLHLERPDIARKYGNKRLGAVLLVGPPGTGKTMLARALANWLGRVSPSGRARFMNIKPGSLHSSYYAQSEANYRAAFQAAREEGARDPRVPVVMFFDEIDSIGAARDHSLMRFDDRVLNAFMAELDGFDARGNVLVVAATNRLELLDPALERPGRLGDLILEVPRPNRRAAVDILSKHIGNGVPLLDSGPGGRDELLDAAVSRVFSPNAGSELAVITLRDGRQSKLSARDLVSGAHIANIARTALERAALREWEGGEPGLSLEDVLTAVDEEFRKAARVLTPANCRHYLKGLPDGVDVVRIESTVERAPTHRYVRVA
jgi:proteasome-associated ATPase